MRRQEGRFLSDSEVLRVLLWRGNGSASGLGMRQHVPVPLKLSLGENMLLLSLRELTYEETLLVQNSNREF